MWTGPTVEFVGIWHKHLGAIFFYRKVPERNTKSVKLNSLSLSVHITDCSCIIITLMYYSTQWIMNLSMRFLISYMVGAFTVVYYFPNIITLLYIHNYNSFINPFTYGCMPLNGRRCTVCIITVPSLSIHYWCYNTYGSIKLLMSKSWICHVILM